MDLITNAPDKSIEEETNIHFRSAPKINQSQKNTEAISLF